MIACLKSGYPKSLKRESRYLEEPVTAKWFAVAGSFLLGYVMRRWVMGTQYRVRGTEYRLLRTEHGVWSYGARYS